MEKKLRTIATGALLATLLIAVALVSCDRRHGIDSSSLRIANVDDVIISLNPPQLFLPSPESVDSAIVIIAAVDAEGVGIDSVDVSVTRTPAIGYLVQPKPTDENGYTSAIFKAQPGVYGTVTIQVTAGNKSRSRFLYISGPSDYSMSLNYSPPFPKLIDHEADPYEVTVTLVDTTQRGVAGQPVTFSILNRVGRIAFEDTSITTPRTNSQGEVTALFYNTRDDEINNPDSALIQAVTSSPSDENNPIVATVSIPQRPVHNELSLEALPQAVFGDGQDSSIIRAFLLSTDGQGIVNDTIIFINPEHDGTPQPIAVTDDNGIARSIFKPFVNHIGTTRIIAAYKQNTIHEAVDTISVDIMPVRAIAFVTASLQKQTIVANGEDSSMIFITVQDSTGGLIADGTAVYLEHTGTGFLSPTVVQTTDGQAVSVITAPPNIVSGPRVDSIFVWGNADDSTIVADTVIVNYISGPVFELQIIRPESTVILIVGSGDLDTIQVAAVDINGNPVANGTQIRFVKEIVTSSISPSSAPTEDGIATAIYLVGSETGTDNVRAFVRDPENPNDTIWTPQPAVFRCLSSAATTLVLSSSRGNIEVGGASCQIIATLQDAFGNPLSEGYDVAFQITSANGDSSAPNEWPTFDTNGRVYGDTIPTNINGQAILQIYSGTKAGAVAIKACTVPDEQDSLFVCDEKSLITISSGPPAFVSVSRSPQAESENPSNPERFVQVGAGVWDVYANPVEYGTAVHFSLIPQDIAEVEGNSFTGGSRTYHPDSTEGWAFSRIIFGCYETFEQIQIVASSAGENGPVADTSESFALPAYDPTLVCSANPGNLRCAGPGPTQCASSEICATLFDGGGCSVDGALIVFTALVAGEIVGPNSDYTDSMGVACVTYRICGDDIPMPPDGIPRIETQVMAMLWGYPDVTCTVDLVCTRPQ